MVDVLTLAAAQAIAKIALDKFVESGAGELGKTLTADLTKKVMKLGEAVWNRIKGNTTAVEVLEGAAEEKPEDLQKLKNYLNALWDKNAEFSQEVKKLADEIHFELTQIEDNSSMTQINHGGTNFQTKTGSNNTNFMGGTHTHGSK